MLLSYIKNLKKIHFSGSIRKIFTITHRFKSSCEDVDIPSLDIPYVDLYENDPDTVVNIRDFCCGRKVILFGVPGAFTPVCMGKTLPGYISRADEFKKFGVDEIACISVNDPFVMSAWGKHHNAQGKVRMFADTNASMTKALDLLIDLPALGGVRSKRYSMVVTNTRIQIINVEPDGIGLSISSAECLVV